MLDLLDPSDDISGLSIQPHRAHRLLSLPSTHKAFALLSACETATSEWKEHDFWNSRSESMAWSFCDLVMLSRISGHVLACSWASWGVQGRAVIGWLSVVGARVRTQRKLGCQGSHLGSPSRSLENGKRIWQHALGVLLALTSPMPDSLTQAVDLPHT